MSRVTLAERVRHADPSSRVILAALVAGLPAVGLSYGTDIDIANVLRAGESFFNGDYELSRPPGNLPYEVAAYTFDAALGSGGVVIASLLTATLALAALALVATRDWRLTLAFIGGSIGAIALLAGLGESLLFALRRIPAPRYVPARLALSAITRPGSPVRAIVIAFGLGLSVLVTVALSQANIGRQIDTRVADDAPAWFFIDIQPAQIERFMEIASGTKGISDVAKTPMLRGRVTELGGRPAADYDMKNSSAWVLRGDRALTWSATPPESGEIVAGDWWPADYAGPPRVSMSCAAPSRCSTRCGRGIVRIFPGIRKSTWRCLWRR